MWSPDAKCVRCEYHVFHSSPVAQPASPASDTARTASSPFFPMAFFSLVRYWVTATPPPTWRVPRGFSAPGVPNDVRRANPSSFRRVWEEGDGTSQGG